MPKKTTKRTKSTKTKRPTKSRDKPRAEAVEPVDPAVGARPPKFPVVAIGASAGGLDAFKKFFGTMAADSGMAFVLIQHLAPTHESMMVDLLSKHTKMKVVQVADQMAVEPNCVFMIPPNKYLSVDDGVFQLSEPIKRRGVRMPIDHFFRSLAENQKDKAICVILSGTGTDGTLGLKAIKEAGGTVLAQHPDGAQHAGMPKNAIETGLVDFVLPVEQLPEALVQFVQHIVTQRVKKPVADEKSPTDEIAGIVALLNDRTDYDFNCYKPATLVRRIERRMGLTQTESVADYERLLHDQPHELGALFKDLLIGVTRFFRDRQFHLKRFTPAATALFKLISTDVGRPVDDIARRFIDEEFFRDARLVLDKLASVEKEVVGTVDAGSSPRVYIRRTLPYRTTDDRIDGVVVTFLDITDRKRIEEEVRELNRDLENRVSDRTAALRESESRIRAILDTAADAIITIDQRGIITSVNPATQRLFGYEAEELVGNNVRLLMPAPYCDEHDGYISRYLATREAHIIGIGREVIGRRKDGSIFPIGLAVSELDHLNSFTGIVRDISALRKLQRDVLEIAAQEDRRIGHELHEGIQQQVTGLELFAGTLRDAMETPRRSEVDGEGTWVIQEAAFQRFKETVEKLCQGLGETHENVRQLSRGILPVQIDAMGLNSALAELASSTDALQDISCRFESEEVVEFADNTAATHLYRIAQEAVNNALRHSRGDTIRMGLTQQGGRIMLEVSDNGNGISPELIGRVGVSEKTSGIGLRAMYYRAGMIGATLDVGRRDEGGTRVRCTM